ncbi:MAG: glycoside hydrolase, partial [Candidatus Eremiobacteraeota bacterium]|nr:glycoside hydrolase [Candidatus Eremiobacteraeota bacterium]
PLHPWLIYGGKTTVYDERTGQTQDVSPTYDRKAYRFDRTNPLVWNRVDRRELYLGLNVVFATRDGGHSWHTISPDLTRERPGNPATLAHFSASDPLAGKHRGVIYSLAPSYMDAERMWAGTDDGLIWLTKDRGAHWHDITPHALGPWSRVTQIDASHFDANTAYASVSRQRLDDLQPYIYKTHDGGVTWLPIVTGLPPNEPVNTVREDPKRRGLLFAGTERTVYVSFDDGAHWQSLQNDLPSTSIRDLVVHGDDVVVGTHGRSFWILDDIASLRETGADSARAPAFLFTPQLTYRVRRDTNSDTPLPPDEPAGQNPPDGAVIDYSLGSGTSGVVGITVYDASGQVVRSFSSNDVPGALDPEIDVPTYWVRPPRAPLASPGTHRFVWDLRYVPPRSFQDDYPIAAIVHDTPRDPEGVLALPGTYRVRLTANGRNYDRPLRVAIDPRVTATGAELREQFVLASRIATAMNRSYDAVERARAAKDTAATSRYGRLNASLGALLEGVEAADARPTEQAQAYASELLGAPGL